MSKWDRLIYELHWIDDLLKIYFWLVGLPYLLSYFTVELIK